MYLSTYLFIYIYFLFYFFMYLFILIIYLLIYLSFYFFNEKKDRLRFNSLRFGLNLDFFFFKLWLKPGLRFGLFFWLRLTLIYIYIVYMFIYMRPQDL